MNPHSPHLSSSSGTMRPQQLFFLCPSWRIWVPMRATLRLSLHHSRGIEHATHRAIHSFCPSASPSLVLSRSLPLISPPPSCPPRESSKEASHDSQHPSEKDRLRRGSSTARELLTRTSRGAVGKCSCSPSRSLVPLPSSLLPRYDAAW